MLVAVNANDRLNFNMQYNVIPVAAAKHMGIIAMKTFADGAMYTKEASWSRTPEHVVRTVGSPDVPSRPLVEYTLTTPQVHTDIIGIGQIGDDPKTCQLEQNLAAAQIAPNGLTETDRRNIEKSSNRIKDGRTNYFQLPRTELSPARDAAAERTVHDGRHVVRLTWQTAFAGDEPIRRYEFWRDGSRIGQMEHAPQTTKAPFAFEDAQVDRSAHRYKIVTVDAAGRSAATGDLIVPTTG
jgi:hypothetical protein